MLLCSSQLLRRLRCAWSNTLIARRGPRGGFGPLRNLLGLGTGSSEQQPDPSELAAMREQALARKRVQDSARAWVGKIRGYHRSQMRMRQYEQIELEMFKYGFSVRDRHSLPCTTGGPKHALHVLSLLFI